MLDEQRAVLTEIEQQILALKLGNPGISNEEIGKRLGLSRGRIWQLVSVDPLKRAIEEAIEEVVAGARDLLLLTATEAVRTLRDLMKDKTQGGHVRRQAARDILGMVIRREKEEGGIGEEIWEMEVSPGGQVKQKKVPRELSEGSEGWEEN